MIFEFLRQRVCESVLAGVYDALDVLNQESPEASSTTDGETSVADQATVPLPAPPRPSLPLPSLPRPGQIPPRRRGRPPKNRPSDAGQ